jgi:hypothetical protein
VPGNRPICRRFADGKGSRNCLGARGVSCLPAERARPPLKATISSANCELFLRRSRAPRSGIGKRSRTSAALASVDPLSTTTTSRLDAGVEEEDAGGSRRQSVVRLIRSLLHADSDSVAAVLSTRRGRRCVGALSLQIRGQLVEQPLDPVLLDLRQGDPVDAGRVTVGQRGRTRRDECRRGWGSTAEGAEGVYASVGGVASTSPYRKSSRAAKVEPKLRELTGRWR